MSPYQQAKLQAERLGIISFSQDVESHFKNGVILSSPEYFLMARPVEVGWPLEKMLDCSQVSPGGNCWFVWAVAGDWRKAAHDGILDHGFKPWLAFERRGKPRLIEAARLFPGGLTCI